MIQTPERIEIPRSKTKCLLAVVGSACFVAMGVWFILDPTFFATRFPATRILIVGVGYVDILFFGLCFFGWGYFFFNRTPGLIVDETGITDHSTGIAVGLIPWSDITDISEQNVFGQKFINIHVKNPDDYLARIKSPWKKKLIQINWKSFGMLLSISSNSLKVSFDGLQILLRERWNLYKMMQVSAPPSADSPF